MVAGMMAAAGKARAGSSPPAEQPAPPARWTPLSRFGMTLTGGGGVTAFTQTGARDVTETGGSWDFRMAFRTRRLLGFEISYVGGAYIVHGLGLDTSDAKLIRNGIEPALRVNAPLYYMKDTLLEPYFAGGLGWNGYRITNTTGATESASPTDTNTLAVPLAVGLAVGYKGFVADARATLRPTFGQTTLRDEGSAALTNWDLGGMIGFEF